VADKVGMVLSILTGRVTIAWRSTGSPGITIRDAYFVLETGRRATGFTATDSEPGPVPLEKSPLPVQDAGGSG
jgi:hypothetical protein